MGILVRVDDEECDRIGPLQDALVTPGVRGQSQLQGEHPGVEGGQVVPLLPAGHHLQDCPGEHLDSSSELFSDKSCVYLSKHSWRGSCSVLLLAHILNVKYPWAEASIT